MGYYESLARCAKLDTGSGTLQMTVWCDRYGTPFIEMSQEEKLHAVDNENRFVVDSKKRFESMKETDRLLIAARCIIQA